MNETSSPDSGEVPLGAFPPTRWTRVVNLQSNDPDLAEKALAELCESYWLPIYSYFRRSNKSTEDAKDLTQSLFEQIIARKDILTADAEKGRLRTFFLTLAQRHLIGELRRQQAAKRGGGFLVFSVDEEEAENRHRDLAIDDSSPEKIFDRQWATITIEAVKDALAREYASRDRAAQFEVFSRYLSWNESSEVSYAEASKEAGLAESAFRAAIVRMRKRFRILLREQVADTLLDSSRVDDELQSLFLALRP